MPLSHDDIHKKEMKRNIDHAKHAIVWIALILIIKVCVDLRTDLDKLPVCACPAPTASVEHPNQQPYPVEQPSQEMLGNTVVWGDLTVRGCVTWQQPDGVLQNLCDFFTEIEEDCVHGIFDVQQSECVCLPAQGPWYGSRCDLHTCFFRGTFDVSSSTCICQSPYSSESMCEYAAAESPAGCTIENCQGVCDADGQCACNKPGQLGPDCHMCASPLIDSALCPGRKNWATEYIDTAAGFAVCGGGYDLQSPFTLTIRGVPHCADKQCSKFHKEKIFCCNPLNFIGGNYPKNASFASCWDWNTWIFNQQDYENTTQPTVFNSAYQKRYAATILQHSPLSAACEDASSCLQRAYNTIQTGDWPLLQIGNLPTRGYVIKRSALYLGLDASHASNGHVARAIWKSAPTTFYLKSSNQYFYNTDSLLQYLFYYVGEKTYCLSGNTLGAIEKAELFGKDASTFLSDYAYWTNLQDQPGSVLSAENYCALFNITLNKTPNEINLVRDPLQNSVLYMGPAANQNAYYYTASYGTYLDTIN